MNMKSDNQYKIPDIRELAIEIEQAFPQLVGFVAPLSILGRGYDSVAVETPSRLVFRFPNREEAGQKRHMEKILLPELSKVLPVPVPLPSLHAEPSVRCPWDSR